LGYCSFLVFGCLAARAVATLGDRIRAIKKPGRRLLSRAVGKLEDDNLFRIRKWNQNCTKSGAKTFQKMDIFRN
jgi:hypothetical protein